MWSEIFVSDIPLLESIVRAVVVYAVILVLIRISGKRGLASMNSMDFVVLFLLAGAVGDALIGDDTSVTSGAVGAVTLVVVNWAVNRLTDHVPWARRLIEGTPTTVISDGEVSESALRKLGMRKGELDHAIRSQQGDSIEEVEHGELTPNGQFVLSLKPEEESATKGNVAALEERLERIESMLAESLGRR